MRETCYRCGEQPVAEYRVGSLGSRAMCERHLDKRLSAEDRLLRALFTRPTDERLSP